MEKSITSKEGLHKSSSATTAHPVPKKIIFQTAVQLPLSAVMAYHHILGMDLAILFRKRYFVSGIGSTAPYGSWQRPGDQRIICFENGTSATQCLTVTVPGMLLSQEVSGFNALIGLLIARLDCRMIFMDSDGPCTTVTVEFTFIPKSFISGYCFRLFGLSLLSAYLRDAFFRLGVAAQIYYSNAKD